MTMNEISTILAVIDPTVDEQPAMRRASWLAAKTGAELELLVCYYNEYLSGDRLFDSPSLEKARKEVIDNQEKHLEELAEPMRAEGIVAAVARQAARYRRHPGHCRGHRSDEPA